MIASQRVGVFGGTFDPPHIGHLVLASEASIQLSLSKILWVLTSSPPHKKGKTITPVEVRLELLEAALASDLRFEISRVEMDRNPPHFAVDTVHILKAQLPAVDIVYLMGSDSLRDLPAWHQPEKFIEACAAIGVMRRPGEAVDLKGLEAQLGGIKEKILWVDAPLLDISSSFVRQRARMGLPYRYYLLPEVAELVEKYHLYREE